MSGPRAVQPVLMLAFHLVLQAHGRPFPALSCLLTLFCLPQTWAQAA